MLSEHLSYYCNCFSSCGPIDFVDLVVAEEEGIRHWSRHYRDAECYFGAGAVLRGLVMIVNRQTSPQFEPPPGTRTDRYPQMRTSPADISDTKSGQRQSVANCHYVEEQHEMPLGTHVYQNNEMAWPKTISIRRAKELHENNVSTNYKQLRQHSSIDDRKLLVSSEL